MDQEFSERLAWARRKAGFSTPREAADAHDWNVNTYKSRENGLRGVPDQNEVRRYARAFGVSFVWLLTGEGAAERANEIAVVGRIGAGAEILPAEEQIPPEGLYQIEVPFPLPDDAIAFEVHGESMWPRYDSGDVIVCRSVGSVIEEVLGFEAAVRTADSRRYLKRIVKGSEPKLYDLESHNAPPMRNQALDWVSPIYAVVRAGQWRQLTNGERRKVLRRKVKAAI